MTLGKKNYDPIKKFSFFTVLIASTSDQRTGSFKDQTSDVSSVLGNYYKGSLETDQNAVKDWREHDDNFNRFHGRFNFL